MNLGERIPVAADLLRSLVRSRWGRIGRLEADLGRRPGYLAKVYRAIQYTTVPALFQIFDRLGVNAMSFWGHALDLPPRPELALDRLAEELPRDPASSKRLRRRLARVATQLATCDRAEPSPQEIEPAPAGSHQFLEALDACRWPRQSGKLLRASPRFHHPAFLHSYLQHLEPQLRGNPRGVAGVVAIMVLEILPRLPANAERIHLLCQSLGSWAACQVRMGRRENGVQILRTALHLARRHRLRQSAAHLLEIGASVLEACGKGHQALQLLDEAQILFLDADQSTSAARVLSSRARLQKLLTPDRWSHEVRSPHRWTPPGPPRTGGKNLA